MRRLPGALLVVLALAACPDTAETLKMSCASEALAVDNPMACQLSLQRLPKSLSQAFDLRSKQHQARAVLSLSVTKGEVLVSARGRDGVVASATAKPGAPATFDVVVPVNRPGGDEAYFFSLDFAPGGGPAEGLTGTLTYRDAPAP